MSSLEIYFYKNILKFDEYFFNGFPSPTNITFNYDSNLKLKWDFDENKIIDRKKNKSKFRVEAKKENEDFINVYEGTKKNCNIENLDFNSNYEIRINSLCNNIICSFNSIKIDKPIYYISTILYNSELKIDYINQILERTKCQSFKLLYRGSKDWFNCKSFHEKCNNKGPTITLIQTEKGHIFGGFTSISWSNDGNDHFDKNTFIFSLSNIYNSKPIKFEADGKGINIFHSSNIGPNFGGRNDPFKIFQVIREYDIVLLQDNAKFGYSDFPISYKDNFGKGNSVFTGSFDKTRKFEIKEIEVFSTAK